MSRTLGAKDRAKKRTNIDEKIRDIFFDCARKGEALKKALEWLAEEDPRSFVNAYLKLLATKQTTNPESRVTNVYAEQINAPQVINHIEDLVSRTQVLPSPDIVADVIEQDLKERI